MSIDEHPIAYRVPFRVERAGAAVTISNLGDEAVAWVRVELLGPGVMTPLAPGGMAAGGCVRLRVRAASLERASRLQITWLRAPGDGPYVWRPVF